MYGEIRYICPGIYLSSIFDKYGVQDNYNYHWDIGAASDIASGYGVVHVEELQYIWGGGNDIQAYWASFIRSFNPNTYAPGGSTTWQRFSVTGMERILFQTGNTSMESVPTGAGSQAQRCAYLISIGSSLQQ